MLLKNYLLLKSFVEGHHDSLESFLDRLLEAQYRQFCLGPGLVGCLPTLLSPLDLGDAGLNAGFSFQDGDSPPCKRLDPLHPGVVGVFI